MCNKLHSEDPKILGAARDWSTSDLKIYVLLINSGANFTVNPTVCGHIKQSTQLFTLLAVT
jgi:hypothetical protein